MIQRGDVVIVDFSFTDLRVSKVRPALVVQNDADNARRRKTVIVLITGNLRMDGDPSHLLIDPATPDGASSGLHGPSLVSCNNLFTIEQSGILRTIGSLPPTSLARIDACLKVALAVS
jgi:mRNA interferase MazF